MEVWKWVNTQIGEEEVAKCCHWYEKNGTNISSNTCMALMQCEGISFWCGDKHVQPSNYSNPTSIYSNQKKKIFF